MIEKLEPVRIFAVCCGDADMPLYNALKCGWSVNAHHGVVYENINFLFLIRILKIFISVHLSFRENAYCFLLLSQRTSAPGNAHLTDGNL